jgi:hypothetical protein
MGKSLISSTHYYREGRLEAVLCTHHARRRRAASQASTSSGITSAARGSYWCRNNSKDRACTSRPKLTMSAPPKAISHAARPNSVRAVVGDAQIAVPRFWPSSCYAPLAASLPPTRCCKLTLAQTVIIAKEYGELASLRNGAGVRRYTSSIACNLHTSTSGLLPRRDGWPDARSIAFLLSDVIGFTVSNAAGLSAGSSVLREDQLSGLRMLDLAIRTNSVRHRATVLPRGVWPIPGHRRLHCMARVVSYRCGVVL